MDEYLPRKKGGRPKAVEARTKRIFCYVTETELREFDEARRTVKGTRAAYARDILLQQRVTISKIDSEAMSLILKMSSNLNQIAKRVNSVPREKGTFMFLENFEKELKKIREELKKVHFAITGGQIKNESENHQRE